MRSDCASCGGPLPAREGRSGPPRKYCSDPCSRAAQHEVRRLNRQLDRAETSLASARHRHHGGVPYWTSEVERLQGRLIEVLTALSHNETGDSTPGNGEGRGGGDTRER